MQIVHKKSLQVDARTISMGRALKESEKIKIMVDLDGVSAPAMDR